MTITADVQRQIIAALRMRRANFGGGDKAFSTSIGINPAQYSRIINGNTYQVLSDASWISLARQMDISPTNKAKWNTANTEVYKKITAQLKKCQEKSISGIFCDDADIGKTYTARDYVRNNKFSVYVDCSQVKSKSELVREIAKEFGVGHTGRYKDVYRDLIYYLTNVARNPLVILDEAGDLSGLARLELKALWNATERCCGWYQMGADGLREVIRKGIEGKRVGYVETFSRYGSRYQTATPAGKEEKKKFLFQQAAQIIEANKPETVDAQQVLVKTDGSLRRIYTELSKL